MPRRFRAHVAGKPGVPNVPKPTDFDYRATHQVTLATKALVASCSDGLDGVKDARLFLVSGMQH